MASSTVGSLLGDMTSGSTLLGSSTAASFEGTSEEGGLTSSTVGLVEKLSSTVGSAGTDFVTSNWNNETTSDLLTFSPDWGGGGGEDETFCRSALWDLNLTWNTDNPDFTSCFHVTVLTYIPAAILLLGLPFQAYLSYTSRNRLTPWGLLNGTKVLLTMILVIISVLDLVILLSDKTDGRSVSDSQLVAEGVRIFTYSLALLLQIISRYRGEVTSGPLFLFWLTAVICGAPTLRSVVQSPYLTGSQQVVPAITFTSQYVLLIIIFILSFFPDNKPKYIDLETQAENLTPEAFASFISKIGFFWFDSFAWTGWKRLLTRDDLWSLELENRCRGIVPVWDEYWDRAVKQAAKTKKELSILTTLVRCFGVDMFWCGVMTLFVALLQFVSPAIVDLIIGFVESDEPSWRGYLYIATISCTTFFNILLNGRNYYLQWLVGLRVRTALTSALYRKSLKLSNSARREMTVGETTNLMSVDTQKFMDLALYINMLWCSPFQILLCMYFLWGILGPASMAGLAVMVLMIPMNAVVASMMKKFQKAQMMNKDKRVKLMDEVLNGIKVLKLYAWESSFSYKLLRIRDEEIKALKKASYLSAFTTFLWTCAPFLVAVSSFTAYILIDEANVLDAQTAFVSLTYFNLLRAPLNMLPQLIVLMVQCGVSLKRINTFMNADELDPTNVTRDEGFEWPVFAEQASYTWGSGATEETSSPTLHDISLRVKEGSLVAVVGQVGCGKSSLLSALLGDMKRTRGVANVAGRVAYVAQQAWIQNNTLSDNITFGKRFNAELYHKVVEACALVPDIEMLPAGDRTEIGEKGINLSGGQKQRVSLARAVYSNGSVYLLDDPLSAVDAHVGKHIFEQVIGPKGLLRNKTRVLVTHGVSFLQQMDQIVVMKAGTITEVGSYRQLLDRKGEFADFLVQYLAEKEEEVDSISAVSSSLLHNPETESELEGLKSDLERSLGRRRLERQLSKVRSERSSSVSGLTAIDRRAAAAPAVKKATVERSGDTVAKLGENIIETERAEVGGVKWSIYRYYARSVGLAATAVALSFYVIYQGFSVGSNIWLSAWSDDPRAVTDKGVRNMYLGVYGALGFLQSISIMVATTVISIFTLNAAIKLHRSMLMRIIKSPMSFYDTTPLGRILNRFAKDIDIVDNTIPMTMRMVLNQTLTVVGTLVAIIFAMPLFIVVVIPVAVLYYFLQTFFVSTARQVKRMEAIARSPIYTHFSETITGSSTIRAFDRAESFIRESERRVDENAVCYYPIVVANRWLAIRLELVGNLIILFASLFAVLSRGTIQPGLVGLSLSYALNVTNALNMLVRMTTEVETNMVSVERIQEYQEIVQEAPFDLPENDPGEEWPEHGEIVFDNYQTRYREGLDLVLKGVNCKILSGEKVGIVGRTGAGKSSLTLGLFRIIEAAGGSISIDGVNISQLGLGRLRSRITIIPQDPVLFAGNMRMNLDPFEQYSDRNVWRALEQAHLKTTVSNFPGGLNYQITEGGENLSVGQRQLVCLARALLRKTKVLVLDEATAAVDLETDDLVQATIRKEFLDCTVLTIAHRLNTIMDSNRVLVLDQGQIAEMASPEALLADKTSIFYGMAKNAGIAD